MAKQASDATGIEELTVVADRGYFKGEEILECENAGITAYDPKPLTSGSKAEGRFGKQDFIYSGTVRRDRQQFGSLKNYRSTKLKRPLFAVQ